MATMFITFLLFCLSFNPIISYGFRTELIHRDSPQSPFYNSSHTRLDRITAAFHRSISRAAHFKRVIQAASADSIESQIVSGGAEYLMKYSIGTPAFEVVGVADTGSDLLWMQCMPCTQCYNQSAPIFDPSASSTYTTLSCQSQFCDAVGTSPCSNDTICKYSVGYGDNSYSNGDLASDTITFDSTSGSPVAIPNVAFGCGHQNAGTFQATASGIVGLGDGPTSIVNQLDSFVGGKFSYCLLPNDGPSNATSTISFGSDAVVSGPGVVSTPMVYKDYYYLTLNGLSIGGQTLSYKSRMTLGFFDEGSPGNIIIDSGTTLTLLPRDFYNDLQSALNKAISGNPVSDPQGIFSLCYQTDGSFSAPTITAHFVGADLDLPPSNTFISEQQGLYCLAMLPSDGLAIFGNLSQMNFLIGYDLVNSKISFKPTDCSSHQ